MTDKVRKERTMFTPDQKLEYAKLMTEDGTVGTMPCRNVFLEV